jgi:hypothetical protein
MKKDVIIVLGGGIYPDGSLPDTVKFRIKKSGDQQRATFKNAWKK